MIQWSKEDIKMIFRMRAFVFLQEATYSLDNSFYPYVVLFI
jgi:hypothetical protein